MQSGSQHDQGSHYKQELDRTLHVLGNVMITISGVAPTASVFIIAPIAYFVAGTGAFLAFAVAAVIGVGMAFSYAEVGTAYPVTGGSRTIVARILRATPRVRDAARTCSSRWCSSRARSRWGRASTSP